MRAAEFKVVEEAKRATQGQYRHFYQVMGNAFTHKPATTVDSSKKKPTATKSLKK